MEKDTGIAPLLREQRETIDDIDKQLVDLLNRRARASLSIAALKKSVGMPIFSSSRENDVIQNAMALNDGPHTDLQMVGYFIKVMENSRQIQKDALIGDIESL